MTDPFASVRRAVLGGAPPPAITPYLTAVGVFRTNIGYVARFPGTAYPRKLISAAMSCSVVCPISIYLGDGLSLNMRLSTFGDGSKTSYNPPFADPIPPGVPVNILWETTTSGGSASVTAQFEQR